MAISSYTELQQAIADNLARNDLGSFIPDFIAMGENWLNYGSENSPPLRCREMEKIAALVPTSGVCALPADYIEYRRVVEIAGTRRNLAYITPDMAEVLHPGRSSGSGERFTIVGGSLYTFPLVSNNIELTYYQALPALALNSSNWLLAKSPGVYLRASLLQAATFIRDDAELETQAALAKALVAGLNRSDMLGKYARASLVSRGITP